MLNAVLRTASVITLLCCTTACQFGSAPKVGQSSGNNARKKVDAGSADAETRRVSTASGDVRARDAEADADTKSSEAAAAAGKGGAGGAGGKPSGATTSKGGSGGAKAAEDKPDEEDENNETPPPDEQNEGENQEPAAPADAGGAGPADAGTQPAPTDATDAEVADAAARPTVDNPFGVLGDLAQRTAGGKTAATINQFLETLAQGEAPAMSIREFLLAIDDEIDCVMNPFATECLAACQAVSTTCAVCVFDEMCRTTMIEICGYSALAGCVPRR